VPNTHARLGRTRETLRQLICHGFDSPQGEAAIARLRAAHAPLKAAEEDYRYVLCTFFLEPIRWNAAYGWRRLSAEERPQTCHFAPGPPRGMRKLGSGPAFSHELATLLAFWHQVGRAMGIWLNEDGDWPLSRWLAFQHDVEARRLRYSVEGQALAQACLRDVVKPGAHAIFFAA
jgi:hypothetical protein